MVTDDRAIIVLTNKMQYAICKGACAEACKSVFSSEGGFSFRTVSRAAHQQKVKMAPLVVESTIAVAINMPAGLDVTFHKLRSYLLAS